MVPVAQPSGERTGVAGTNARCPNSSPGVRRSANPSRSSGRLHRVPQLCIAQDDAADELLSRDPLALLIGMLLDQHVRQRSSET